MQPKKWFRSFKISLYLFFFNEVSAPVSHSTLTILQSVKRTQEATVHQLYYQIQSIIISPFSQQIFCNTFVFTCECVHRLSLRFLTCYLLSCIAISWSSLCRKNLLSYAIVCHCLVTQKVGGLRKIQVTIFLDDSLVGTHQANAFSMNPIRIQKDFFRWGMQRFSNFHISLRYRPK